VLNSDRSCRSNGIKLLHTAPSSNTVTVSRKWKEEHQHF